MPVNLRIIRLSTSLLFSLFITLYGCAGASTTQNKLINEIVLEEGMTIIAYADWATIEIAAVGKNKRDYTWGGQTVSVNLMPRQQRWYGSLGLYHPQVRPPHKGVVHMVVEEGQQHFHTIDDAILWLESYGEKPIYRDDGLVVATRVTGSDSNDLFVGIDVWQIYVGGVTLSEYQETAISSETLKILKKYQTEKELESYKKINFREHHTGGNKPTKIPGSQNSKILVQ